MAKHAKINSDQDLTYYIKLKAKEKRLQAQIDEARPAFNRACDVVIPQTCNDTRAGYVGLRLISYYHATIIKQWLLNRGL